MCCVRVSSVVITDDPPLTAGRVMINGGAPSVLTDTTTICQHCQSSPGEGQPLLLLSTSSINIQFYLSFENLYMTLI